MQIMADCVDCQVLSRHGILALGAIVLLAFLTARIFEKGLILRAQFVKANVDTIMILYSST